MSPKPSKVSAGDIGVLPTPISPMSPRSSNLGVNATDVTDVSERITAVGSVVIPERNVMTAVTSVTSVFSRAGGVRRARLRQGKPLHPLAPISFFEPTHRGLQYDRH